MGLELQPDGRTEVKAVRTKGGSFRDPRGILKGKTNGAQLSIEEINYSIVERGDAARLHSA